MQSTHLFTGLALFSLSACSTLPKGAPEEYHAAQAALNQADEKDVEDVFPQTLARAEAELDEALGIFAKTRARGVSPEGREELLESGKQKASNALSLAEKAIELDSQVKSWDERIERKAEEEEFARDLRALRERLTVLNQMNSGRLVSEHVKGPLVFFEKGDSSVSSRFEYNLAGLAEALRENPTMQVTLIGHTDSSGNSDSNVRLSEERATNVAKVLLNMGVADEQIMIDAQGSLQASDEPRMERRVDAFLINRSSADIMTTGR